MKRSALVVLFMLASASARAEPVDLACHWGKPAGKTVGGAAAVARLFSAPTDPLYLKLDLATNTVANNDPNYAQNSMLPKLRVSSSGTSATITASTVTIKELGGIDSLLEISIDRYTLESEMLFLMALSYGSSPVSQWTRTGKCMRKLF